MVKVWLGLGAISTLSCLGQDHGLGQNKYLLALLNTQYWHINLLALFVSLYQLLREISVYLAAKRSDMFTS